ncbi:MAG: hypothetical protein K8R92_11415 [Planctomycetes bacterium]|nr:hypothetical protein [Planctomycetota bacterium]
MCSCIKMLPPILRKKERWVYFSMLGAVGACFLFDACFQFMPNGFGPWPVLVAVITVPTLLFLAAFCILIWSTWTSLTVWDRVKQIGFRACGHCGCDLGGMETPGHCPRCGAQCDPEKLRGFWKRCENFRSQTMAGGIAKGTVPKYLRNIAGVFGVLLLAPMFLFSCFPPLFPESIYRTVPALAMCGTLVLLILAIKCAQSIVSMRLCRHVTARDGLVCLECGGDLVASGSDTKCAQCHAHRPESEVREQWNQWKPPCWNVEAMDA